MGEDISSGAKIGIILIILCALIAIVFALLTMMKNVTNTGSTQLQSGLDQMLSSQFQDYDQKIITGTQLISAMAIFDGQPITFVVHTSLSMSNAATANGYNYGVRIKTGATLGTYDQKTTEGSNAGGKTQVLKNKLLRPVGSSAYQAALDVTDGVYSYNLNTKPMTTSGTDTYIRGSGKFLAELIDDPTGEHIGICFTQQN